MGSGRGREHSVVVVDSAKQRDVEGYEIKHLIQIPGPTWVFSLPSPPPQLDLDVLSDLLYPWSSGDCSPSKQPQRSLALSAAAMLPSVSLFR